MAPTNAALRLAAGVLLAAAVVSAIGPFGGGKRTQCTLEQSLAQCDLDGGVCVTNPGEGAGEGESAKCGLCYYCNPGVGQDGGEGTAPNPDFSLAKCKAAASAVLKNAIACDATGKAQSVGCQNNGYSRSCQWATGEGEATSSLIPEASFIFTDGACFVSSTTCVSSCATCNPASPCFDLDICKWTVSGILNQAALYNSQSCICSGTTA